MLEAILQTLKIMGWLGLALGILAIVNILTGILTNVWSGKENFMPSKLIKGIEKVAVFYLCATFVGIVFTMLPYINDMVTVSYGNALLSQEMLDTFSNVGVLGIIISTITVQAKKAISGIMDLSKLSSGNGEEQK